MGRARNPAILAAPPGGGPPAPGPHPATAALAGLLVVLALLLTAAWPATAAEQALGSGLSLRAEPPLPPALQGLHGPAGPPQGSPPPASAMSSAPTGLSKASGLSGPASRRSGPVPSASPSPSQPPADDQQAGAAPASPLERRLEQWPAWRLPAPLARPGRSAPPWPAWFSGEWEVETLTDSGHTTPSTESSPPWRARFHADGHGNARAVRACNALAVGRSLLGERLLSVQDDPGNPQRQLARLAGDQLLETTLIAQRGERPQPDLFLNDELSLQVLHGPGEPRVSRIETLGRWRLLPDGSIAGEQWQARYGSPADGLAVAAASSGRWRLSLVPVPPGSGLATGTGEPATDCR